MIAAFLPFFPHFGMHYIFHYTIVLFYALFKLDYRGLTIERIFGLTFSFTLISIYLTFDVFIDNADLYDLREYLKIIILVLFFFIKPIDIDKFVNSFFLILSLYLILVLFSYILSFELQSLNNYYYFPGMESLGGASYARHVGVLGNPNHTALFYVISFLILVDSRKQIKAPNIVYFLVLILLSSFIFLTLSRSVLFSFLFVYLLYKFSFRRLTLVFLFFCVLIYFVELDSLIERFTSLSSLNARFSNWDYILTEFGYKKFFFGVPITELEMAFDSEYLLVFVRHGLFFLVFFVVMNVYFIIKANKEKMTNVAMIHSVLLACAFSMATYSDPRILFLTLVYTISKFKSVVLK